MPQLRPGAARLKKKKKGLMSLWKGKGLCPWTQVFKVMENMQRSLEGLPGSVVTAFQVSGRCGGAWTRV